MLASKFDCTLAQLAIGKLFSNDINRSPYFF
jgi:hypothetical protein